MKGKIKFGGSSIKYLIIQSKRRKTSEIIVDKDGVTIRTSSAQSLPQIKQTIEKKADWIYNKQLELKKIPLLFPKPIYELGSKLPYLGKTYVIQMQKNSKNDFILKNNKFLVRTSKKQISKKEIQILYEKWLMKKASPVFEKRVKKFSKIFKLEPKKIIIKKLKSKWGGVSKDNIINFNVNLLKAPSSVIDYIVLHEMVHLKIKNHSNYFWIHIRKHMPDYVDKKHWLEIHKSRLI